MASSILGSTAQSQVADKAQTDSDYMLEMESMVKSLKTILTKLISLIEKMPKQSGNSGTEDQKSVLGTDIIGNTTPGRKAMETSNKVDQNGQAGASANAGVVIKLDFDNSDNNNVENEESAEDDTKNVTNDTSGPNQINYPGDENKEIDINEGSTGGWGDPHFDLIGANGNPIHFDHKGVDYHNYHLFTGDNIRIDGEYVPTRNPLAPQVIGSTTAYLGNDVVTFAKDGSATLNGEALDNGSHMLEDGTEVVKRGDVLSIIPNDGSGAVDISAKWNSAITVDPSGKFRNLGGIIGKSIEESRPLSKEECDAFDLAEE
ncbi:MAG: hypothetical protein PVJ19_20420 [Desulfobacteraceae bacterium]|jgi:hypothetical protein